MDTLKGLIDEFSSQGILDSSGRFTVCSGEALRKLRESRLGDPQVYALALFRALVCSGARRIEVEWDLDDLWWTFDGPGLPKIEQLALASDEPTARYLQIGALGALSRDPQFLRYRGPDGGWQLCSPERPVESLPNHRGTPQLHLRRRLGKTLLWSLARRILKEKREVDTMQERCADTELTLTFQGKSRPGSLALPEAWEVVAPGAPRLRLTMPTQSVRKISAPPIALHALLSPVEGQGTLTIYLCGVRLDPQKTPWPDCDVVISLTELELDLSQQAVVQNATYRALMAWLRDVWLQILLELVRQRRWHVLVGREVIRPESPLRESLMDVPLFCGYSYRSLTQGFVPVGLLPPEQEATLVKSGGRLMNTDLSRVLKKNPELRARMLVELFRRHNVTWAIQSAAQNLPHELSLPIRAASAELFFTLQSVEPGRTGKVRRLVMTLLTALERVTVLPEEPMPLVLAYLEAALLLPDGPEILARPLALTQVRLRGGQSLQRLALHFRQKAELPLTDWRTGPGLRVPVEIGQRIALGLRGEAVTWNGRFCANPLAADEFLLLPLTVSYLESHQAGFSSAESIGSFWRIPIYPNGFFQIDTVGRTINGEIDGIPFSISKGLSSIGSTRREEQGDDKTHIYYTVAFSDGLRNYLFEERGKSYHASCYSDSDTDVQVDAGVRKALGALRALRLE